jgi:hypothetical protein
MTSIWNATKSTSSRLSSMATLRKQPTSLHLKVASCIPADKVLLLWKSLHGLKQSPRCLNMAFDKWPKSQALAPSQADPCHYYRSRGDDFLMLSVHVDDQLIVYNNRQALDDFQHQLNAKFKCSDSGPA